MPDWTVLSDAPSSATPRRPSRSRTFDKRQLAQVFAIELEQIERPEERVSRRNMSRENRALLSGTKQTSSPSSAAECPRSLTAMSGFSVSQ